MLSRFRRVVVRPLSAFLAVAILSSFPVGCGEEKPTTGTKSEQPPEIQKANENMLNSMKKDQAK